MPVASIVQPPLKGASLAKFISFGFMILKFESSYKITKSTCSKITSRNFMQQESLGSSSACRGELTIAVINIGGHVTRCCITVNIDFSNLCSDSFSTFLKLQHWKLVQYSYFNVAWKRSICVRHAEFDISNILINYNYGNMLNCRKVEFQQDVEFHMFNVEFNFNDRNMLN